MDRLLRIPNERISITQLLVYTLLIGGVAAVGYAFTRMGLIPGLAISAVPAIICVLYITIRYPGTSMMLLFIANYFIMGLTRYIPDSPFGVLLDLLVGYNLLILALQSITHKVEWKRAASGLTWVALAWFFFCTLQFFNPEARSVSGWISGFRSIALNFLLIPILTQLLLADLKYLKWMLYIWTVLTLIAVGKACVQKFIGFNDAEYFWLYVLGARTTHIIHTGIRYFSFFSDAANFGASMGLSMVVFSISSLYFKNKGLRLYLLLVAAAACYGMLLSGTRSALAVPFAGYGAYILMSRNTRIIIMGGLAVVGMFCFLNFTRIGQGNALIRRARSAFNADDPSFQVRLANQARLRVLMKDKPFGVGLGEGGGKALRYSPDSEIAKVPTDSWFVMMWVETGVVGVVIHILILLYILMHGGWLVAFRLRDPQVKGLTAALTAGMSGIVVMAYANEVFGQIPNGAILYMSAGFIFLSPYLDQKVLEAKKQLPKPR